MPKQPRTFDYEPLAGPRPARTGSAAAALAERPPRAEEHADGGAWRDGADGQSRPSSRPAPSPSLLLHGEVWGSGRGHALSFAGLLLFTVVLYFRPQEYYPALASAYPALVVALLTLAAFIPSQVAAEGTLTARPREVNLVLLLCAAAALSVPLAISPPVALGEFWNACVKSAVTFILIVNIVRTERRLKLMLYLALAITILLCLTALNDYRLGNLTVEGYRVSGRSTGGMFENSNDLGIHLVTMVPISVALALSGRGVLRKLIFVACAASIVATIVVTFSRGAFLALIASGLFITWKFSRRNRVAVFGALILAVAVFVALAPGEYWVRVGSIFDSSLDRYGSSTARSELLKRAFVVSLANPVLGLGAGNFPLLSRREQVTHNSYTQVSAEIGLAAAVIYAMFIIAPLRRLQLIERETAVARRASQFYYLAVGLQASLIAYMVSSFFASVAFYLYIYYLVGYAVCLRRIYLMSVEREGSPAADAEGGLGGAHAAGAATAAPAELRPEPLPKGAS